MRIVVGGAESRTGVKRKIVWLTRMRYCVEIGQIRAACHKAVDVWRLRVASYFVVVVVFLKDDDDMLVSGNTGHNCISPNRTTESRLYTQDRDRRSTIQIRIYF